MHGNPGSDNMATQQAPAAPAAPAETTPLEKARAALDEMISIDKLLVRAALADPVARSFALDLTSTEAIGILQARRSEADAKLRTCGFVAPQPAKSPVLEAARQVGGSYADAKALLSDGTDACADARRGAPA